jgi:hypothetical protein
MTQPAFVLVRPQMGENIGAAARGMWNFGLDRMHVVAPRDGWPNSRAVAMASGAGRLLDAARLFDTTPEAVADATWVLATTARDRDLTKPVYTPEEAMREARPASRRANASRCSSAPNARGSRTTTSRAPTPSSRCRSTPPSPRSTSRNASCSWATNGAAPPRPPKDGRPRGPEPSPPPQPRSRG